MITDSFVSAICLQAGQHRSLQNDTGALERLGDES